MKWYDFFPVKKILNSIGSNLNENNVSSLIPWRNISNNRNWYQDRLIYFYLFFNNILFTIICNSGLIYYFNEFMNRNINVTLYNNRFVKPRMFSFSQRRSCILGGMPKSQQKSKLWIFFFHVHLLPSKGIKDARNSRCIIVEREASLQNSE